jgi:hypothetical protein
MTKKKLFFLISGAILALLLVGCKCDAADTQAFVVLVDGPAPGSIVDTHPVFTWHEEESCTPDKYHLYLTNNWSGATNSASEYPAGDELSHTWSGIAQGGLHAYWRMAAMTENDVHHGPYTEVRDFYVGPLCSGETLVAPELYRPIDAAWISHHHLEPFEWHYKGGCLPSLYDYQFATDPGFTDIVDSGTTPDHKQILEKSFPSCSSLFWRVRANDGTSTGPWSDARQFHWVTDETCWQNHYLSDNVARINVKLYQDICDQTGILNTISTVINPGCVLNEKNNRIYADGQKNTGDWNVWNYTVDLGAGPCPSAGLDQMTFNYDQDQQYFHVLAPGTYCVSISKNQTVTQNGAPFYPDLNDGLWTDPFTTDLVAGKTVTLGPGLQDVHLEFGWDEWDQVFLRYPVPENIHCRIGPDTICDPLKIPMAGEMLLLLARDMETEWKMASYEGETCFVYLPAVQADEVLSEIPGNQLLTADLPFYEPQPPCPTPTPVPSVNCPKFTNESTCKNAGCAWVQTTDLRAQTFHCVPK